MNVFEYIKQYAQVHGIKNYFFKSKYLQKQHAGRTVQMAGGVAFFYKIFAEGDIANAADLTKKFLQVETPTDFWDLSPVAEIEDFGTIQKVSTNFIFMADNTIKFKLFENTADAMFSNIYNFCAQYIYMFPLPEGSTGSEAQKEDFVHIITN